MPSMTLRRVLGRLAPMLGLVHLAESAIVRKEQQHSPAMHHRSEGEVGESLAALRIPRQLVLTSKDGSIDKLPAAVQENIEHTLRMSHGFTLRWLSDVQCKAFIAFHYDEGLEQLFEKEKRGSFRGDICRAAVLAQEGGFYLDIDLALKVNLEELVDPNTTFISSFDVAHAVYNAILACMPNSPIMQQVIKEIPQWYAAGAIHSEAGSKETLLGPVTLLRALHVVTHQQCPANPDHPNGVLQRVCGDQVIRMYQERPLQCHGKDAAEDCPQDRTKPNFDGVRFGVYTPGADAKLVAWSRFVACLELGCGTGGSAQSLNQSPSPAMANLR